MMKARSAHSNNRRRPHWWSALLSLLVTLSLVIPPSQLCALMETAPGYAHSDGNSHAAPVSYSHSHGDSHEAASGAAASNHHDGDHHHAAAPRPNSDGASVSPLPDTHSCCSDGSAPSVVMAVPSRSAAPDENLLGVSFMPATLPVTQDIFALTNCHGRDGPPPDQPLRSQFLRSSLLGRAPPVSV